MVLAAGAGAGAAVAAVALSAGLDLAGPSWKRARGRRARWLAYALLGGVAAATVGPWVVAALILCGLVELIVAPAPGRRPPGPVSGRLNSLALLPLPLLAVAAAGGTAAIAWVGFKVGALSYGGGFVIIPLMQGDAVDNYGWMTSGEFLNAVALGQVTPGPVTHTVAVVGYAAGGVGGALLASLAAFAPSFLFVLAGGPRFDRIRANAADQGISGRRRPGRDRSDPRRLDPARGGARRLLAVPPARRRDRRSVCAAPLGRGHDRRLRGRRRGAGRGRAVAALSGRRASVSGGLASDVDGQSWAAARVRVAVADFGLESDLAEHGEHVLAPVQQQVMLLGVAADAVGAAAHRL